jgi:hypothetical protein
MTDGAHRQEAPDYRVIHYASSSTAPGIKAGLNRELTDRARADGVPARAGYQAHL